MRIGPHSLEWIRRNAGHSQKESAKLLRIRTAVLKEIEEGRKEIRKSLAERIADLYDVKVRDIPYKRSASNRTKLSKEVREQVLSINPVCQKCSYEDELHVHHVIPKSKGGSDDISNLMTLCVYCHYKEHEADKVSKILLYQMKYPDRIDKN